MKLAKYWYYGTMFLIFEFFFRVTLNWSSDWERVMEAHGTADYFLRKAEANRP